MRTLIFICLTALLAAPATAQDQSAPQDAPDIEAPQPIVPDDRTDDAPPVPDIAPLIESEPEILIKDPVIALELTPEPTFEKPDYSDLSEAEERAARLNGLFERIGTEEDAETANLIAEEIWAIWLDSGSDSVNMLLRRGTAAEKRGDKRLARRMYDHVTTLSPGYVEGWSRSARLAISEDDLSRALTEVTEALILEPRHFYALWTMGNIFERIGKNDAALEAYSEAAKLYPELKAVKDRLEFLGGNDEGDIL